MLPLNPTGYGDSPYQCFSAFAGNPLLLSLERLRDQGLLQVSDLAQAPPFPQDFVDYGPVIEFRLATLRRAAQVFFADGSHADRAAFDRFCESASPWLDDYALFMACKDAHHGTDLDHMGCANSQTRRACHQRVVEETGAGTEGL